MTIQTIDPTPSGASSLGGSSPTHTTLHTQIRQAVLDIVAELTSHESATTGAHGMSALGASFVALASAAAQRSAMGLGSAATQSSGAFDAAGTAASAVSSHSGATSGIHGISPAGAALIDDADAAAQRATLSVPGLATENTFTEDQVLASGKFLYLGAKNTDGSWRIATSGNNLVFQRRESGSWVTKLTSEA